MMVQLGDKVKDTISGFSGIVVAKTEWLNGCVRVTIQPLIGKDGKLPESATFDIEQLVVLKSKASSIPQKVTGGDRPDVHKRTDPL